MDSEELDTSLQTAWERSAQTGTTTPLMKQVLRLYIQKSRLDKGQEELPKTEFREPETYPLTAEEERRRDRRRERNRVAARKCRQKKKSAVEQAEDNFREEMRRKNMLLVQIRDMEREKKSLEEKLGLSVEVELEKPAKRKKRSESSTTVLSSDRPAAAPLCTTPHKLATPSHSPLPIPTRPPPPYTPTLQSPSFHHQGPYNQLNQGSCYEVNISPPLPVPPPVFSPLEISTSHDFDPLFTYTSPGFSRRPSTSTYTETLAESQAHNSPTSLHMYTEPPPFDMPPQVSASAYHPLVDLLAVSPSAGEVSPSAGEFSTESSPTFLSSYNSPEPLTESPSSSSSLHVLTESPLPDTPLAHLSSYQPGSMVDLLAMSPSAEFFRPQSPPVFPTPYYELPPCTEMPIPTLPSEASFQNLPLDQQNEFITSLNDSAVNIPTGNIPSTVYETLEKDTCCDVYKPVNRLDEAQVLTSDDELCSSQESELLTMYS